MTQQWRLIDGEHLFEIAKDPSQSHDVSSQNPEVVERLRSRYESWWTEVSPRMTPVRIHVGNPEENPMLLNTQDWYMPVGNPPLTFNKLPKVTGPWMLHVERAGRYRVSLCQWPFEAERAVVAETARVRFAGVEATKTVEKGAISVSFELEISDGDTTLETYFTDKAGETGGAYYTYVEYLGE